MTQEIFKDIPTFEGVYQVSNLGRVKSCERYLDNGLHRPERIMKQQTDHKGYKRITLYKDGKNVHFVIHRLVAMMFIPNPYNKPQIDHINCDKTDNRVENLRWCTNAENVHFAAVNGLRHIFTPEESHVSRKVAKLDLDGNEICVYPSLGEAHRQNPKASVTRISQVCRQGWGTAGGFKWEFRSAEIEAFKKSPHGGVKIPIVQYDENMNKIAEYESIAKCGEITKTHFTCIHKSLREGVKTWNGYYFKYKNEQ